MFERYTENARRVVFFARYEAGQLGSQSIDADHILLGLIRGDHNLLQRFVEPSAIQVAEIRKRIEREYRLGEKISASVDLPLSSRTQRVLTNAAEEAEYLHHSYIGTEHLLLGVIKEGTSVAADILARLGMTVESVRAELVRWDAESAKSTENAEAAAVTSRDDLVTLVTQMRALANAMLNKCDQIEKALRRMPPSESTEK